jgi:hypothetical protein
MQTGPTALASLCWCLTIDLVKVDDHRSFNVAERNSEQKQCNKRPPRSSLFRIHVAFRPYCRRFEFRLLQSN